MVFAPHQKKKMGPCSPEEPWQLLSKVGVGARGLLASQ